MFKKSFLFILIIFFTFSCQRENNSKKENLKYVSFAEAKLEKVEEKIEVVGTLKAKFETSISAEFQATVEDVFVTEWIKVNKGTLLAKLDTKELEVQLKSQKALFSETSASYERAKREAERVEKMYKAGLATKQNVEDALTFLKTQEALLEARKSQIDLLETKIRKAYISSPIDGYISMRAISKGDLAGKDPLFKVVDLSILDLVVNIPSIYLKDIKIGNPIFFKSDSFPDKIFEGKISFINPSVDTLSDTIRVIAEVKNPQDILKAGLFVKGYIRKKEPYEAILIPKSAFLKWDLESKEGLIYVLNDNIVHLRNVKFVDTLGNDLIVIEGISPQERYITDGVFLLRDGERVQTK